MGEIDMFMENIDEYLSIENKIVSITVFIKILAYLFKER